MAFRDYILCDDCGDKLLYDGHDTLRESLEEQWSNPDASVYTVGLLCPDCLRKLHARVEELEAENARLRDGEIKVRTADLPRRKPRITELKP